MHATESAIHRLYARLLEVFERETTTLLMQGLMPGWPSSIAPDPRLARNLSRGDDAERQVMYTELAEVIGHPEVDTFMELLIPGWLEHEVSAGPHPSSDPAR
jgi:hypothetical protein